MSNPVIFPTPMIVSLAQAAKTRFYSAKLEGLTDQAAFEEIIRTTLNVCAETIFKQGED